MNCATLFRVPSYIVRKGRSPRGFTLIELMIVVAIIGMLSSVAVPAFLRNAQKARSTEALIQLHKIYAASRTYIIELHHAAGSSVVIPPQFPVTEAPTPDTTCCSQTGHKCLPNPTAWNLPTWQALQFSVDMPHYYRYAYTSAGSGPGSSFHAQAYGDLNCNGVYSTFELYGEWNSADHDVHGSAGFFSENELE